MFCQITIRTFTGSVPSEMVFAFEVFGCDNLAEVKQTLLEEGSIHGRRFASRPDGDGARRIRSAFECVLSHTTVMQVVPLPEVLRNQAGVILHDPAMELGD